MTERPAADLAQVVGRDAERLRSLAVGVDGRPVRLSRVAKGVSAKTTLNVDLADYEALQPVLWRLSERVALRLKRSGLAGRSVTLKLKDRTFRLRTRARSGLPPTQLARYAPLRGGAASPARRMRRHDLPPHRDRRVGPLRWRGG